jgi:hypothetical protein
MGKTTGLGDGYYQHGVDLSGDIAALSRVSGGNSPLELTGIDKSAFERAGGKRDGNIALMSWFNPAVAPSAHASFSALPTADVISTYLRGQSLGDQAFCLNAKQANYDGTRGADGSLTFAVDAMGDGFAGEWCANYTGKATITAAGNSASVDAGAASSFGLQAYLHVFDLAGTSATIKLQSSSDDGGGDAYADIAGASFGTILASADPTAVRIAVTGAIERYLRVNISGTFSTLTYAVFVNRNPVAVSF